jgi:hypothetical protein
MAGAESETIDQTSKLARRLGMTYGELSGLSLAGNLAGVSMDTIGAAATKADVAFVKAAQGSKQAQAAFAGVGLSVEELQGLSPAERFQKITDAIAGLPTEAERARAAVALFGKSGSELLPLFEGGANGIRAATEQAKRFGSALTNEQGQSVENMNDAFTRAYAAVSGVVQQVVAFLAPAIQGVTDTFTNLIGGIGGANVGQFIGEGIMVGAQFLAGIADWMISGIGSAFEYAGVVSEVWNRVVSALQAIFFIGESVFKGVGAIITSAIAKGAMILDALPDSVAGTGWAEFGKSMENSANKLARDSEAAAGKAATAAGNVITGDTMNTGQFQGAGTLATIMADGLDKARADAAAMNASQGQTVGSGGGLISASNDKELKGTDSRSKEGVAEMFRLMRGANDDIAERQLETLEKIHEDLSEGSDETVVDFAGA